jgi:ATP-binding cassette, subfamily B, bacterial
MKGVGAALRIGFAAAPVELIGYLVLTAMAGAVPVATAWFTRALIDGLTRHTASLGAIGALAGGIAGCGVLAAVTPPASTYLRTDFGRAVSLLTQDRLYAAVNGFDGLRRFEDPAFFDRLRMAQYSGESAPGGIVDAVLGMIRAVITAAGFVGILYAISPVLTALVFLSAVPVLLAEIRLARRRAATMYEVGASQRRELFYGTLLTNVQAAKEIRLFGLGDLLRGRMRSERLSADRLRRQVDRRAVAVQSGLALLSSLISGAGLVWVARSAGRGALTVGDITMFIAAIVGVQGVIGSSATNIALAHQQLLMFDHFRVVTRTPSDLPVAQRPSPLPPLRSGIELRDVWFRYSDTHPWVLRGVNLWIPYGRSLALVGLNGAGKSTLVKLLCRFYDPTRGAILWDGVDIRDVSPAQLRRRLGAVFQDYMQYDMTAAENVGLGDLARMDDRAGIEAATREAGIHDKLAGLPDGYGTMLSRMFFSPGRRKKDEADGVVLSGGQWQRIALARAFFRGRRDLLVLDEPSSGLDAEAEYEIHARIRERRAGQTSLLISHRLGVLRQADEIVVLDGGAIVERGGHDELMRHGGVYARLFRKQANGYQIEAPPAALRFSVRPGG